jgi:hypothetical protein
MRTPHPSANEYYMLRRMGVGFVNIRKYLFTFYFPLKHVKNCLLFSFMVTSLSDSIPVSVANALKSTQNYHPKKTADNGGSAEKHRECRSSHMLFCFTRTLTNALVSL